MNPLTGILQAALQLVGTVMFTYYGWVAVVGVLAFLIWQNRRREQWVSQVEHCLLMIEVPKENEKKELSAEQDVCQLHGILRSKAELRREGSLQEHISFEIAAKGDQIHFYIWTPKHLKDFVEGQVYAQYPSVRIREGVEDYAHQMQDNRTAHTLELELSKKDVLPIKTFQSFEVDPLAGITAVLAGLNEAGEEMWIQILARPLDDVWQEKGMKFIDEVKEGKSVKFERAIVNGVLGLVGHVLSNFLNALVAPPGEAKKEREEERREAFHRPADAGKGGGREDY